MKRAVAQAEAEANQQSADAKKPKVAQAPTQESSGAAKKASVPGEMLPVPEGAGWGNYDNMIVYLYVVLSALFYKCKKRWICKCEFVYLDL